MSRREAQECNIHLEKKKKKTHNPTKNPSPNPRITQTYKTPKLTPMIFPNITANAGWTPPEMAAAITPSSTYSHSGLFRARILV